MASRNEMLKIEIWDSQFKTEQRILNPLVKEFYV